MALTPTTRRNYASSVFDTRTRIGKTYRDRTFDMASILNEIQQRPEPHYNEGDMITSDNGTQQRIVWCTYNDARKEWQYRLTTGISNRWGGQMLTPNINESELIQQNIGHIVPKLVQDHLIFNPTTRQLEAVPEKRVKRIITSVSEAPPNSVLLNLHSLVDESALWQRVEQLLSDVVQLRRDMLVASRQTRL